MLTAIIILLLLIGAALGVATVLWVCDVDLWSDK